MKALVIIAAPPIWRAFFCCRLMISLVSIWTSNAWRGAQIKCATGMCVFSSAWSVGLPLVWCEWHLKPRSSNSCRKSRYYAIAALYVQAMLMNLRIDFKVDVWKPAALMMWTDSRVKVECDIGKPCGLRANWYIYFPCYGSNTRRVCCESIQPNGNVFSKLSLSLLHPIL